MGIYKESDFSSANLLRGMFCLPTPESAGEVARWTKSQALLQAGSSGPLQGRQSVQARKESASDAADANTSVSPFVEISHRKGFHTCVLTLFQTIFPTKL